MASAHKKNVISNFYKDFYIAIGAETYGPQNVCLRICYHNTIVICMLLTVCRTNIDNNKNNNNDNNKQCLLKQHLQDDSSTHAGPHASRSRSSPSVFEAWVLIPGSSKAEAASEMGLLLLREMLPAQDRGPRDFDQGQTRSSVPTYRL